MELKQDVNGKEVKFLLGLYSLGKIREKYNVEVSELVQKIQLSPTGFLVDIIYDCHSLLCELDGVPVSITKRDFILYLDGNKEEFNSPNGLISSFIKHLHKELFGDFPIIPEDSEDVEEQKDEKKN